MERFGTKCIISGVIYQIFACHIIFDEERIAKSRSEREGDRSRINIELASPVNKRPPAVSPSLALDSGYAAGAC
jgi:hypothetical protein